MPCDLMLFEHTGPCDDPVHCEALKRRAAGATRWHAIERREDAGGFRDFLDDRAIHCGEQIELQSVVYLSDDFGEYTLFLDAGTHVRYEANLSSAEGAIGLHASVGGHSFYKRCESNMRFRWPKRR